MQAIEKWKSIFIIINYLRHSVGVDKVERVKSIVHGVILGIPIAFPLPNPDACVDSGLTCPLEKDKEYEYLTTLPVLGSYPKVGEYSFFVFVQIQSRSLISFLQLKVLVRWELQNENGEDVVCIEVPARIE